ncbi:hypothetical protein HBI56_056520 [Parastagonospora nodorum]|uniref:Apple domain-containing protein n=2 Tax=Phaeosphaeria nodorum (strain SN15 / ATCC MYA-4574 / FGSC 10173) TaxID=321614 RepID=A0A7U2IC77_PHANO|nr:hypothetical protein SNOG_12379 [Parastagonospora nodorum SN15]KAH3913886.1 hypothetical protein HBH56_095590 [Parastagonospora nodorum]EAT80192.1 hypothetical protein SNOG_12379 [Parastagonospora nodorum SN15]KAH3930585.1 hypothetical protein HBH54_109910 [Parastagonospora nodorum]KAH3944981.1 hypothetical protein HBH53_149520 [Parastagonospora nodorum]KAH3967086.1 hypothetical protein HBH51_140930 [Parastagonospora nodorum]
MRVTSPTVLSILASGFFVSAAPAKGCNRVDAVYMLLKGSLQSQASSLCVQFLGGDQTVVQTQIQTVTGPARIATITAPDETQTIDVEVTNVNQVYSTETVYLPPPTTTQTVTVVGPTQTIYQKRGNHVALPPKLASFASSRISSACSCIATPTTRTISDIQTFTIPGSQATTKLPGATISVTLTKTLQITSVSYTTTTLPATTTIIATATTTVRPILVKQKICNAKGLPGSNAFNYGANFNTNQDACVASCKTDTRCLATGFYLVTDPSTGTTTGTCRKYDKAVVDSADLGFGYYNFNDKAC